MHALQLCPFEEVNCSFVTNLTLFLRDLTLTAPLPPAMCQDIAAYHEGSAATYSRTLKKAKVGKNECVIALHCKAAL